MPTITAVYENGVLRPTTPLALAEGQTVEVLVPEPTPAPPLSEEEIERRLAEAKTIAEWVEATKLLPTDNGDYEIEKWLHESRKLTGFRYVAPEEPQP